MTYIIWNFFHAGISAKIKGEANTCWTTDKQEMDERGQYQDETQTVTAHEDYFEMKYYLIGSTSGKIRLDTRLCASQKAKNLNNTSKFYSINICTYIYLIIFYMRSFIRQ